VAQKVSVTFACDYDGKDIPRGQERTRSFGIDGREFEIDLCRKHNDRLDQVLQAYIEVGRKAARAPRRRRTMAHRQRSAEIRAWAKQRGIEVSDRGRIPAGVVSRFEAAERRG
jgi:Lsr2